MKKILLFILIITLCLGDAHASEFYAKNYIVMQADSMQVLEGKKIHEQQSVASISKIMTAIVAIENCALNTEIELSEVIAKAYGSAVYLHIGDKITMQDLLYALLLRSGNDAALAIADHVGGNIEHFVEMMNQKAQELQMTNTIFNNPSGLDEEDDGNLSTVYDMAILMNYCIQNPIFEKIIGTQNYHRLDKKGTWKNKNKLLLQYDDCIGGKTGYTKKAKRTLVNAAKKDGLTLICVTFNCGDDFNFHKALFEKHFSNYTSLLLFNAGTHIIDHYEFTLDEDLTFPVLKESDQKVTYQIQDERIVFYLNHKQIANYAYEYLKFPFIEKIITNFIRMIYE